MAESVRFLYDADVWDAATITASSEAGDLEDDNAVHDFVGRPWRSTGDTAEWIKFDLGSAEQITCVALFGFNFTSAATVTLQANSSDSWGAPPYSQALTIETDSEGDVLKRLVFFLDETYQWWRITIADAANPDGYVEIGRIIAGAYYEPPRGVSEGVSIAVIDPSQGGAQNGLQAAYRQGIIYRRLAAQFRFMNLTQRDKFEGIFRKNGRTKPFVIVPHPTTRPTEDALYGYLTTPINLAHILVTHYHSGSLVFEEKVA